MHVIVPIIAASVCLLQAQPPVQHNLRVGDAYTYDLMYGEKGGSEAVVSGILTVECGMPKARSATPAGKAADYLLNLRLASFTFSCKDASRSERMRGALALVKGFSFSAEMDRMGDVRATDLPEAVERFLAEDGEKKAPVLANVLLPLTAAIWTTVYPRIEAVTSPANRGKVMLRDRDWSALGLTDPRWSVLYRGPILVNLAPERSIADEDGKRRLTGRLILWRQVTIVRASKEFGARGDISEATKMKIVFREGVCEETDEESRTVEDGGTQLPVVFFRCRLKEQQEMDP